MSMLLDLVLGFPMVVFFFLGFLADVPPPPCDDPSFKLLVLHLKKYYKLR
jgi:hypothetical protein